MPEKSKNGKRYKVSGKVFTWTTEDGSEVEIPMRIKLGVIRKLGNANMDAAGMMAVVDAIAPGQESVIDEMDLATDFQPMFEAWQEEYNALTGATPGE